MIVASARRDGLALRIQFPVFVEAAWEAALKKNFFRSAQNSSSIFAYLIRSGSQSASRDKNERRKIMKKQAIETMISAKQAGFTLIELTMALAIIAVLAGAGALLR